MARSVSVAEGFIPIGEFKARAARLLDRLRETRHPLVLTQHGRPAAVLLSPAEYDRLQDDLALVRSVAAGLADAESGRTMDTKTLRRRLATRRRSP